MADDMKMEMNLSNDSDSDDNRTEEDNLLFSTTKDNPSASSSLQPSKKRKTMEGNSSLSLSKNTTTTTTTSIDSTLVKHARKRLSKWAARLFDPDRPRGLVEPPQTIPLNDEFLTAFGKREKAENADLEIDTKIESDGDEHDENDEARRRRAMEFNSGKKKSKSSATKIKISNLSYRTTGATLTAACEKFGPLEEVNLILDKEKSGPTVLNSGRAYVTFEHEESAQACLDGLKKLDGRDLRLALAAAKPSRSASTGGGGPSSLLNRYYNKDISTICYRCGQVGHIEPNCPNAAKPKPCPLCAKTDHDMRGCPLTKICFNCGVPGHINKDCTHRRGLPKRMVCGICFQAGHHRMQCHSRPYTSAADAVCMDCGQMGHFLCKDLTFFYGLRGISCFNCGAKGHSGYSCYDRPSLFHCIQDPELTNKEIARAESESIAEQMERERQERERQRGRQMGDVDRVDGGERNRSMPPRDGGPARNTSGGGGTSRRRSSDPRNRGRGYR